LGTDATVEVLNTYIKVNAWCISKLSSSKVKSTYGTETPDIKTSTFTYYTNGNLNTSLASGITNTYIYNGFGNVLSQTTTSTGIDPKAVSYIYDATGRFVETTTNVLNQISTFEYNDYGQLISETGIDGLSTQYAYDNWGKIKTVTYPNGKKSNYETKWLTDGTIGFYIKDITEGAPDIILKFDQFGRKVRTESQDFKGKKYSDIIYNTKGQVQRTISPYYVNDGYTAAQITDYMYDQYNRATSVTSNGLTKTTAYSGKIITETFPSGETKVSTMDAAGKLKGVNNNGAYIAYNYYSDGQIKNTTAPGSTIGLTYDTNGFKDILSDPDAGSYNFNYNVIGQLTSKTSSNGTYSASYDVAGRITTENENGNNFSYSYITSGNGINQIDKISDPQGVFRDYDYDSYGQITNFTQKVGDKTMSTSYQYDTYGRTIAINYPGEFGIKYVYQTITGELIEIHTNTDQLVWKLLDVNSLGQLSKYQYGNYLETNLAYDTINFIQNISTGTVQNISYNFDAKKGRFTSRKGLITKITENFTYYTHNQLSAVTSTQKPELNLSMLYSNEVIGNITSKSDVGTFLYDQSGNAGPHAVTDITNVISSSIKEYHNITYTSFNKVSQITQGQYRIEFIYGADKQRTMMQVFQNEVLKRKVYYFGNYERHEEGSNVIELYYISSASGLTAIYKKQNGVGEMYYVHTDHLGSIHVVTGQDKLVKARYFYNVWGERKNLDKTVGNIIQRGNDLPWLHRGFTGHEYITEIDLINMNGRVYDPKLGMFISPDPFVQAPDNPVNFNRYVYALNNPLLYTDPSGEFLGSMFWTVGLLGEISSNLIHGVDDPFGSAFDNVSSSYNGMSNCLQFEVYQNGNTTITAGLDPFNAGISANLNYSSKNWEGNVSAGIGFISDYINGSLYYKNGDWKLGVGAGSNSSEYLDSKKYMAGSVEYKGFSYYQTYYGGEHAQRVGGVGYSNEKFSFRLENDFLAGTGDKWRTNAFEVSIGKFVWGTSVYTNDGQKESGGLFDKNMTNLLGKSNKSWLKEDFGAWINGKVFSAPGYIGVRDGNNVFRMGYSSKWVQDRTQNWVHRNGFLYLPFGHQNFYTDYSKMYQGAWGYSGYYNPFSLY